MSSVSSHPAMEDTRPFRVIIGGGGIAGLTLANALEKANVDYILLEGRNTISPQVGASIGIHPNGARILDQLGVFDKIEQATVPLTLLHNRHGDGRLICTSEVMHLSHRRHNYPATFLERENVLRFLYENLQDKSKIRLEHRISNVDHNSEEVIVLCQNGTAISGDILIGCDGVNSTVRKALWRVAGLQDPTAFDIRDKTTLMTEYQCLFGISTATNLIENGVCHVNYSQDVSTAFIGGKSKVFWFIYQRLDKVYKVPNIPRYTKHDAEVFASGFENLPICDGLKFKDVWKNRTTFTLVATEEAQMRRWAWGRIAGAGDCVHKMTPNMGAGGNTAMESAVTLANMIKRISDASEKGRPSFGLIKDHLSKYQKIREQRVTAIVDASNDLTRIHALKTWKDKLIALWILPLSKDLLADTSCDMIIGAVRLEYLPVPERSLRGTMPFNPSQGLGKQEWKSLRALKALPFLSITAVAAYVMFGITLPPMRTHVAQLLQHGIENRIGQPGFVRLIRSFYGVGFIDSKIRALAAVFAFPQFADPIANWQAFSFLMDAGIVYAILLIESARRANIVTFASLLVFFGVGMQFFGMGVLLPVYCFLSYIQSPIESFRARDMRLTDMSYTGSVLPVIALAHFLPGFGSMLSFIEPQTRHTWNWIWQLFPIHISILQFLLKKTVMADTVHQDKLDKPDRDMPTITYTIGSLCALASTVWWYTIYSAPYSLTTIFIPSFAQGQTQTGEEYIRMFLQVDELCVIATCFLWLLYLYGDLKKAGMMEDSWASILLKGVVSLAALGPGVTIGAGWLYRERLLATKWHKDALVPGRVN